MCMPMCRAHTYTNTQKPEESSGFPGGGVVGSCDLPGMSLGNRAPLLRRAANDLNSGSISSAWDFVN